MILLRRRHHALDPFRSLDPRFNLAWLNFFKTQPPGIHAAGVVLTIAELCAFATGVPAPTGGYEHATVEPANGNLRDERVVGGVHGSRR